MGGQALAALTLLVCLAGVVAQRVPPGCRVCGSGCQAVPRADGSCPICICDGVALTDCPVVPRCDQGCRLVRGPDGCQECQCREAVVCPAVPPCPEECQVTQGVDGCPSCECGGGGVRVCPAVVCPRECALEVGRDGCQRCQCGAQCPAVPPCLRGCVDMDEVNDCFSCNCSLPDEAPDPFGPEPFGPGPFGPLRPGLGPLGPGRRGVPGQRPFGRPFGPPDGIFPGPFGGPFPGRARCPGEVRGCPRGCRVVVGRDGCRGCVCGDDAFLCPGVPRCAARCLTRSPEDRCCRCDCQLAQAARNASRPGLIAATGPAAGLVAFISFRPNRPGRPFQIPARPVEPPVDPIQPPVDPIEPPVDPIQPPVDPIQPPVDPIEPPVDPVEPPVDPIEPPVDPEQSGGGEFGVADGPPPTFEVPEADAEVLG